MTNKDSRLPLRCIPVEGEEINGFVVRLATRNGMDVPAEVVDGFLKYFPTLGYPPEQINAFAKRAGVSPEALANMQPEMPRKRFGNDHNRPARLLGVNLTQQQLLHYPRRVCPACLAEDGVQRLSWSVKAITGCLKHGLRFVGSCICRRKLGFEGPSLMGCKCGADLRLGGVPWQPERRLVTTFVEGRFHGAQPTGRTRLDRLSLDHALTLMEWLGELVYHVGGPDLPEAGMLHGLALLSGPDAPLFQQVRERARKRGAPGVGVTLPDGLQLGLPGLHDDHQELIADLVREAASAR